MLILINSSRHPSLRPAGLPDSLRVLELRGNKLSGDLPALPPNLAVVSISGNSFTGDISTVNFTGIQTFLADNQQFTGGLSDTVATAPELDSLSMQGSGISGQLPQKWNTPQLSLLDLSDNALTGECWLCLIPVVVCSECVPLTLSVCLVLWTCQLRQVHFPDDHYQSVQQS